MKDKVYLWAHKEGTQNNRFNIPGISKISPVDACNYMGIENVIMVKNCFGQPLPDEYEKYAESFKPLRKVVWSLIGAGGKYEENDKERIIQLKKKYKNITGAIMDDFFIPENCAFTPEGISEIREELHRNNMELWTVLYQHQLELNVENYLKGFDVITYWTWYGDKLNFLEKDFEKFLRKTEGKRRILLYVGLWK